ncbi:unnamed protein product [Mycena citricolor]|uniref:Acid phosphatase n=1 Tax=Mycena citricolor TaxID=2018698 RepID=A0AAD2K1Q0_9AGAR|nr:unnamed protein product [Mycena citricolor]
MKQSLRSLVSLLAAASSIRSASAAVSQAFAPPSPRGPLVQTANYTAFSNSTLDDKVTVAGKVFDRIMIVWLENTDFATAAATPTFQKLAKEGILFTDYNSVTHPSQPNYIASMGGDFFGAGDDTFVHIPSNITTVIDLLEEKGVSWAAYQESIPTDGFFGYSYTAPDYLGKGLSPYTYYMRKHNPPMIYDAVAGDAERVKRIRSFNDFANDAVNGTLPQWMFVTPNMVNDAHDTTIDFAAEFLDYWLVPLLSDTRVNGDRTLILLTFDETETYSEQNTVYTVALGSAIPAKLKGTKDATLYTHYSLISTVQANWDLQSLGRQDTNKTVANVFDFVAQEIGYTNTKTSHVPHFNLTGIFNGPLNPYQFQNFPAPNVSAVGVSGRPVLLRPGLDTKLTVDKLPAPVNLHAKNRASPYQMNVATTSLKNIIPCTNAACS